MKSFYKIAGYLAHSEQDNYKDGCHGKCLTKFTPNNSFIITADSMKSLINKLQIEFSSKDINDFLFNSCDEMGRLDLQVIQRVPFECAKPSSKTIEEWKAGEIDLWLTCYTFNVEMVQVEIDLQTIFDSEIK